MPAYYGESHCGRKIQNFREQLLALPTYQQVLQEEKRKCIALKIHDELNQSLTGLKMKLHLLNRQIKDGCFTVSDSINYKTMNLISLIDNIIIV